MEAKGVTASHTCMFLGGMVQSLIVGAYSMLQPVVLNEVLVKKPVEADADPSHFQISHIDRVYHLKAPNETER